MSDQSWNLTKQRVAKVIAAMKEKDEFNWEKPTNVEEIRGGAIIPTGSDGTYEIQAHTARGMRKFCASESSDEDLQSESDSLGLEIILDSLRKKCWEPVFVKTGFPVSTTHGERAIATHPRISVPIGELPDGESPAQILRLLGGSETSEADRRQAVLLAEVLDFEASDRSALCTFLRRFVLQNRNSNVAQDLVTVGAAIRKLVAYLPTEELGTLNEILTPSPRMAIPLEIELEVVKTVVRKLTWHPPLHHDSEPELADKLLDIVSTYLNPRLLPREKYGATTLNAVLSLLLLRSHHVPGMIAQVETVSANWFTQLACRRIDRLFNELRGRVPAEAYPAVTGALVEFTTRLCHVSG